MHKLTSLYGGKEAAKSPALERYTVSSIVKLIKDNGWESDVDLVAGGHLHLIFTESELRDTELDLQAAEKAGVPGIEAIELLDAEVVKKVSPPAM